MDKIHHIYDSAFKRILTLSSKAVVHLVNGLFGTEYPSNSTVTYNWTEHEDADLNWTLADAILTINGRNSYHMEAQMTKDEEIVFRVFEYGFGHAYKGRIVTNTGGTFLYRVPVVKLQSISTEELNNSKMVILIPFLLLKLRNKIKQARTKENIEELQSLIMNDIIGSINQNEELGNISKSDAYNLKDLTLKLYWDIYAQYRELEEFTMRYDQSMRLESDKYDKSLDELEDEVCELKETLKEQEETLKEQEETLKEQEETLKEQERIIGELRRQLAVQNG